MAKKGPKSSFNFKTQRYDKRGRVVETTPYRLFVEKGKKKIEQPPGSGIFYNEDGTLIPTQLTKDQAKKILEQENQK